MGTPFVSRVATSSIMAFMIFGTPAMTKTLPIWKPGAFDTGLSMSVAPTGIRAMRIRASFGSRPISLK